MANLLTPPPDTKLTNSAAHTLTRLSQRSSNNLAHIKSLYTTIADTLNHEPSFFLPVPTSPCNSISTSPTAIFQDTGALITMPSDLARLVLRIVEGRMHTLSLETTHHEERHEIEMLSARLAAQQPDHVTNVIRLWETVIYITGDKTLNTAVKDLGVLFQHRDDEVVVVMDRLGASMERFKIEDDGVVVSLDEYEEMVITRDGDKDEWET